MTRAARSHASAAARLAARSRGARALLALFACFALAPAAAQAATRAVQAYDSPSYRTVFWPASLPAQVGDTVTWRLTQPGNPRAAVHDLWLVAPGTAAPGTRLGASYETPAVSTVVGVAGTYRFYCSIHGGLAPGGMNGTIVVGATDPGPPLDPGKPWETGEEPPDPNALVNDTTAPTILEEGDNEPPTLNLLNATPTAGGARARVEVAEPVTVTVHLKKGTKIIATRRVDVIEAGRLNVNIALPQRLRDNVARYRLQVWATDGVDLNSSIRSAWIDYEPPAHRKPTG